MYFVITTGNYPKVAAGPLRTYAEAETRATALVNSSNGKPHVIAEGLFRAEPSHPPVRFVEIVPAGVHVTKANDCSDDEYGF